MNDELQRRLGDLPDDAPRSKLEPYREHILRWRRRGKTFRRIAEILYVECGLKVSIGRLHGFVANRQRNEKPEPAIVRQKPPASGKFTYSDEDCMKPLEVLPRKSPEEIAAMREAARSSNHKPVFQPPEEAKPLFVYDPDRPLTNKPIRKD